MKPFNIILTYVLGALLLQSAFANSNQQMFERRVLNVLENRKATMVKKISIKINSKEEEVKNNINFVLDGDVLKVLGHVNGSYGICEITGEISIIETSVVGKCISDTNRVSIIWP